MIRQLFFWQSHDWIFSGKSLQKVWWKCTWYQSSGELDLDFLVQPQGFNRVSPNNACFNRCKILCSDQGVKKTSMWRHFQAHISWNLMNIFLKEVLLRLEFVWQVNYLWKTLLMIWTRWVVVMQLVVAEWLSPTLVCCQLAISKMSISGIARLEAC